MGGILKSFINDSRTVGILLLACTFLSLMLTNSPWGGAWLNCWHWGIQSGAGHHVSIGQLHLPNTVSDWINDFGMALFFCLAGMEMKRELTTGELSTFRQAILPAAGAIGGMLLPALIFLGFNHGLPSENGWGIPMATDIAFSLGVAAILGSRVPSSMKVFLTALAIIDDLGAIIVIAVFYTHDLGLAYLFAGLGIWVILLALNALKVPFGLGQILGGLALWYCIFNSGVHATVAGVLFAFAVPASKLEKGEHQLKLPVNFLIIPAFALANTSIHIPATFLHELGSPLSLGILCGLLIGKTLGISGIVYLMVRTKVSSLPAGSNFKHLLGTGMLAAIGFTMSIFITLLALDQPLEQDNAKIAIFVASLLAMILALCWFGFMRKTPEE
jgi:NhaA family Na+:H+ antiporter